MYKYEKAVLGLFNGLEVEKKESDNSPRILDKGCLIHPAIFDNYSVAAIHALVDEIILSGIQLNSTFHKSWAKIAEASIEQLVVDQILHYLTTYGFETLGIYDKDLVYIPSEKLDVPELKEDVVLKVIKAYTKEEIKNKALDMAKSGIALKETTVKDLMTIFTVTGILEEEVLSIKNKELFSILCDKFGIVPKNPVEFLRYVIFKTTGKTLLIKDRATIEAIAENVNASTYNLFDLYNDKYGYAKLSSIFLRFKPLFLAFRNESRLRPVINKLRRLADFNHKPVPEDSLNSVTANIKQGKLINISGLADANLFRKIRLAYALKYRTLDDLEAIVYKIRNGKSWATEFDFENKEVARGVLSYTLQAIARDIKNNVCDKKIYIPDFIEYALPATEKQFTGNFPSGTCVTLEEDMVVGVHWENLSKVYGGSVDLDLSLTSVDKKIGWDAYYRNGGVLFSGDITDAPAPKGASEFFYISKKEPAAYLLNLNYFNYHKDASVPFDLVVGYNYKKHMRHDYLVDPNAIVTSTKSEIDKPQKTLGLILVTQDSCKFYYSEFYAGKSITTGDIDYVRNARKYLLESFRSFIGLREVLSRAGAILVENREDADIDLSPEVLEKDTIINLLTKKE